MIKTKNNLKGKVFGKLTVIEQVDDYISPSGQHKVQWKCDCECGNTIVVRGNYLTENRVKSCGCYRSEFGRNKIQNLVGKRYGKLMVVSRASNKGKDTYWNCKCDCGNYVTVLGDNLKHNRQTSCGCIKANDLTNMRFGKLRALSRSDNIGDNVFWNCVCDCGQQIKIRSTSLTSGNTRSCGCLVSSGELKIGEILNNLHIKYVRQKSFQDCKIKNVLRFDFYLPEYDTCIEFQGKQHYMPIDYFGGEEQFNALVVRDETKKRYCNKNNIQLVEIKYDEIDNAEEIIRKAILC